MARILLLEDEPAFAEVLSEFLGFYEYRVDVVDNLAEAQDNLIRQDYDLVITDMFIRAGDRFDPRGGLGLINWLRAQRWNQRKAMGEIPIIAISGQGDPEFSKLTLSGAHTTGANKVFVKPMDPDDLLQAIETLLGTKRSALTV